MAEHSEGVRMWVPLELSVRRLLAQAGYRVQSAPPAQRRMEFFDTVDRRLAAAGADLSLNRRDGWCWRRDTLGHPKLASREWTAPAMAQRMEVLEWSRAFRRGRPIAARAALTVHRRSHRVGDAHAGHLLTLVEERLDEQSTAGWRPRLRRVDVIGAVDDAAGAKAIALIHDSALADGATLALLRPAQVRAPRLKLPDSRSTGARELFTRSATLSLLQWLYFDCEVSGGSPEALRKLRVALRRLRSDLQTFAPLLDREWAGALRGQLGELATRLGTVRDAEVLTVRLAGLVSLLPPADRDAALPLLDTAGAQLADARAELIDGLAGDEYLAVLDRSMAAVTRPRWVDGDEETPAVTRLARRPWRRLRDYVATVDDLPEDAQLHRIRILAKRARYAADACVPAEGDAAARCAARLADLQTVLGNHHDAVVTREWLHRQAAAAASVSFIAGELASLELGHLRDAAERWRDAWVAASRSRNWRWLRS